MSWDAELVCDGCGSWLYEQNYTHNTNRMVATAMERCGYDAPDNHFLVGRTWWTQLHGMTGADAAKFLSAILDELESDPERYRAMNPSNGWGSYDGGREDPAGIVGILRGMRDASTSEVPCHWQVSG